MLNEKSKLYFEKHKSNINKTIVNHPTIELKIKLGDYCEDVDDIKQHIIIEWWQNGKHLANGDMWNYVRYENIDECFDNDKFINEKLFKCVLLNSELIK